MMRRAVGVWAWWLMAGCAVGAQSPTDGRVEGHQYVNSYFHVAYTWPATLKPSNVSKLVLPPKSPYQNEFLLFSARQGDEAYGVVMVAEKLHAQTPHGSGIRDGADLLDRIIKGFKPEEEFVLLSRRHFVSPEGLEMDEFDYTTGGEFNSGIAAKVGEFLILFKCNARSKAELEEMDRSVVALHVVK